MSWRNWFDAAAYTTAGLAAIVGGWAIIYGKFISPLIARPLARHLKEELKEEVVTVLKSQEVTDFIQESIAQETAVVLEYIQDLQGRSDNVEKRLKLLESQSRRMYDTVVNPKFSDRHRGSR